MYEENALICPEIAGTLLEVRDIAGRLGYTIAGLSKRSDDMKVLFSSELTQYSFYLNNLHGALAHCRDTAQGKAKITKAKVFKNPLIAATVPTTLKRMVNAMDVLRDIHKDICYRKKNNAVFTTREITKFIKTLSRIQEACECCIRGICG